MFYVHRDFAPIVIVPQPSASVPTGKSSAINWSGPIVEEDLCVTDFPPGATLVTKEDRLQSSPQTKQVCNCMEDAEAGFQVF